MIGRRKMTGAVKVGRTERLMWTYRFKEELLLLGEREE